jgi:MoaA/NifB/PqqE/SkfB family radical SAM enzyme
MYTPEEIQAQKDELRQAVLNARPFKPLNVKLKVFYGCNLKCEMCNHWQARRKPPISSDRFREVLDKLAEVETTSSAPSLIPPMPHIF